MGKHIIIFLFMVALLHACGKKTSSLEIPDIRTELQKLSDPVHYLDTLSSGTTKDRIDSIVSINYGARNRYYFYYSPGGRNVLSRIHYIPDRHPQSCAESAVDFLDSSGYLSGHVALSRTSMCLLNRDTSFYEYYPSGALRRVCWQNGISAFEYYFQYGDDGHIKKIYYGDKPYWEQYWRFGIHELRYDNMGNVIEMLVTPSYSKMLEEKYEFLYDLAPNPFQGLFGFKQLVPTVLLMPTLPKFISKNNVTSMKKTLISNGAVQELTVNNRYDQGRYVGFNYFNDLDVAIYYH